MNSPWNVALIWPAPAPAVTGPDVIHLTVRHPRLADMAVARLGGATLEEIAEVYRVSRERVRQLLKEAGLEAWESPFKATQNARNTTLPSLYRYARQRKRKQEKRRRQVEILRALAATLGRVPTFQETAHALGYRRPHAFFADWKSRPHQPARFGTHRFYRCAGLKVRGLGADGILDPDAARRRLRDPAQQRRRVQASAKANTNVNTEPWSRRYNVRVNPRYRAVAICGPDGCLCRQKIGGRQRRRDTEPPGGIL